MRSSANKCPPVIPAYYKGLTWPNQPCAGDGDDDGFNDGIVWSPDDGDAGEPEGYITSNPEFYDLMSFERLGSNNAMLVIFILTLLNRNILH